MKEQGKILKRILVSFFVGGVLVICLGKVTTMLYQDDTLNEKEKIIAEEKLNDDNNIVEEPITVEISEDDINTNEENTGVKENSEIEDSKIVAQTNKTEVTEKEKQNNKIQDNNKKQSNNQTIKKEENKVTEDKTQPTTTVGSKENETKGTNVSTPPTPPVETPKPVTQPKEEPKKDEHTYKYNATITEKIKQDIENNKSEYMKQYGCNIVVDQSIVTQTNQFTYTKNRVKDMIKYKFGTIKIYARDYYLNGNYMYTESYII